MFWRICHHGFSFRRTKSPWFSLFKAGMVETRWCKSRQTFVIRIGIQLQNVAQSVLRSGKALHFLFMSWKHDKHWLCKNNLSAARWNISCIQCLCERTKKKKLDDSKVGLWVTFSSFSQWSHLQNCKIATRKKTLYLTCIVKTQFKERITALQAKF